MPQDVLWPLLLLTFSFSLFASTVCTNWTENLCGKWKHLLCKKWQETKPITHRLQYIMKRTFMVARATNPCWHMLPLTVVYSESGPLVSMQTITMAWHSLWINCASWHTQLAVSNSGCDLCTAAPNILLEWGHKSTAGCLILCAIIHNPCFNCPVWRWCKHDRMLPLALAGPLQEPCTYKSMQLHEHIQDLQRKLELQRRSKE